MIKRNSINYGIILTLVYKVIGVNSNNSKQELITCIPDIDDLRHSKKKKSTKHEKKRLALCDFY